MRRRWTVYSAQRKARRPGRAVCIRRRLVHALDGDPDEPGGTPNAGKSAQVDSGLLQARAGLHQAVTGNPQADPGSMQAAPGRAQAGGGLPQAGLKSQQAGPGDAPAACGSELAGVNRVQAGGKSPSAGWKRSPEGRAEGESVSKSSGLRRNRPPAGYRGACGDGGKPRAGLDGKAPGPGRQGFGDAGFVTEVDSDVSSLHDGSTTVQQCAVK